MPPNGNLFSFLSWLPLWGKIAIVIGTIISSIIFIIINLTNSIKKRIINSRGKAIYYLIGYFIFSLVFIILPMLFYFTPIWDDGSITIEKILGLKKVLWKPFLFASAGSILSGLAGFFVLKSRIGILPGAISAVVIAALIFLGIFMFERARAFQRNTMFEWLQKHPQGKEVLDEFAM